MADGDNGYMEIDENERQIGSQLCKDGMDYQRLKCAEKVMKNSGLYFGDLIHVAGACLMIASFAIAIFWKLSDFFLTGKHFRSKKSIKNFNAGSCGSISDTFSSYPPPVGQHHCQLNCNNCYRMEQLDGNNKNPQQKPPQQASRLQPVSRNNDFYDINDDPCLIPSTRYSFASTCNSNNNNNNGSSNNNSQSSDLSDKLLSQFYYGRKPASSMPTATLPTNTNNTNNINNPLRHLYEKQRRKFRLTQAPASSRTTYFENDPQPPYINPKRVNLDRVRSLSMQNLKHHRLEFV